MLELETQTLALVAISQLKAILWGLPSLLERQTDRHEGNELGYD